MLGQVRRAFPATPFRLLVPPDLARAVWLPGLAREQACAVSVTEAVDPDTPDIVTLARHAQVVLCLSPAPEQSPDTRHLIRWKRQGHREAVSGADREPVPAGPVHFWDLSRAGQARPKRLGPKGRPASASFRAAACHLRSYNRRAAGWETRLGPAREVARKEIAPPESTPPLTPAWADAVERHAANVALAARFRPWIIVSRIAWRSCAGAAAALLLALPDRSGLASLGILAAWILRAWHRRWHRLATGHDLLAELAAVHWVRSLAGLPALDPAALPAPFRRTVGWVPLAAAAWTRGLGEPDTAGTGRPAPGHLRCVREGWMASRRRRLEAEAADRESRTRRLRRITAPCTAAIVVSLNTGLVALASPATTFPAAWWAGGTVALAFLTALAGQLAARHRLEAQRRRRELRAVEEGAADLDTPDSGPGLARTLLRLTSAALEEQADRAAAEHPGRD
jgi:hypothetical protein